MLVPVLFADDEVDPVDDVDPDPDDEVSAAAWLKLKPKFDRLKFKLVNRTKNNRMNFIGPPSNLHIPDSLIFGQFFENPKDFLWNDSYWNILKGI